MHSSYDAYKSARFFLLMSRINHRLQLPFIIPIWVTVMQGSINFLWMNCWASFHLLVSLQRFAFTPVISATLIMHAATKTEHQQAKLCFLSNYCSMPFINGWRPSKSQAWRMDLPLKTPFLFIFKEVAHKARNRPMYIAIYQHLTPRAYLAKLMGNHI